MLAIDKVPATDPELVPVRFEFTHLTATTVCVAGSFNQWRPEATRLRPGRGGRWLKETALRAGAYEYCFIVDDEWLPDPLSAQTVPNPFGGRNSILNVAHSREATHLVDAENLPLKNPNKSNLRKL